MYNSGNSSKNVTGSAIVDGTVEAADLATAVNNDIALGVAALPKAGGTMTGNILLGDNAYRFGASNQHYIYSRSTGQIGFKFNNSDVNSYIDFTGTVGTYSTGAGNPNISLGRSGANSVYMAFGLGSPEGVVTSRVGGLYTNGLGSTGTTLYVKESGTGNTGWVAK